MNYFSEVGADGDSGLSVLWEEGERVFCRAWREVKNGDRTALLAVIPASEQPTPNCLDRLAHECALKESLTAHGRYNHRRSSATVGGRCWFSRIQAESRLIGSLVRLWR
jgi:hypothetical protein